MDGEQLRAAQAPLKQRYRDNPEAALVTLHARGAIGDGVTCSIETGQALARRPPSRNRRSAGQRLLRRHVAAGAGRLCRSHAQRSCHLTRSAGLRRASPRRRRPRFSRDPRRFQGSAGRLPAIRLAIEVEGDLSDEQLATLIELTERYCVVYQTLKGAPALSVSAERV